MPPETTPVIEAPERRALVRLALWKCAPVRFALVRSASVRLEAGPMRNPFTIRQLAGRLRGVPVIPPETTP